MRNKIIQLSPFRHSFCSLCSFLFLFVFLLLFFAFLSHLLFSLSLQISETYIHIYIYIYIYIYVHICNYQSISGTGTESRLSFLHASLDRRPHIWKKGSSNSFQTKIFTIVSYFKKFTGIKYLNTNQCAVRLSPPLVKLSGFD